MSNLDLFQRICWITRKDGAAGAERLFRLAYLTADIEAGKELRLPDNGAQARYDEVLGGRRLTATQAGLVRDMAMLHRIYEHDYKDVRRVMNEERERLYAEDN